jgi:hypothetical protein
VVAEAAFDEHRIAAEQPLIEAVLGYRPIPSVRRHVLTSIEEQIAADAGHDFQHADIRAGGSRALNHGDRIDDTEFSGKDVGAEPRHAGQVVGPRIVCRRS